MSNEETYLKKYHDAMDHLQIDDRFEEKLMERRNNQEKKTRRVSIMRPFYKQRKFYFAASACAVAVLTFGIFTLNNNKDAQQEFNLSQSTGNISIAYTDNAEDMSINAKLVELTENQIFHEKETDIVRGTIKDIKNIEINMGADITGYKAIATIEVDKVLRGDIKQGDEIQILLSTPIGVGQILEDTGVVSSMQVGMEGIFMPSKFDDSDVWSYEDSTLYYKEICDYGFNDGERYAFLNTENGLKYATWAFPTLVNPASLDDVEAYVVQMIASK
jgi:hypothetical protein